MTDILDDLRAYLAGDNSVIFSPRRVAEMIAAFDGLRAELAAEFVENTRLAEGWNKASDERDALRAELAAIKAREAELVKMVAENRSRPDALRADKAEAELASEREKVVILEAGDIEAASAAAFGDTIDHWRIRVGALSRQYEELEARLAEAEESYLAGMQEEILHCKNMREDRDALRTALTKASNRLEAALAEPDSCHWGDVVIKAAKDAADIIDAELRQGR